MEAVIPYTTDREKWIKLPAKYDRDVDTENFDDKTYIIVWNI